MHIRGVPSHLRDYIMPASFAGLASSSHISDDPDTYAEALASLEVLNGVLQWKQNILL